MNTTAAALQANVTTATIHAWARHGVIAATKQAGRWFINAASLAHRITIGAMRTRKAAPVTEPVFRLTDDIDSIYGTLAVTGPASALRAAQETGTPITLSGLYEGEQVHLGYTAYSSGGTALRTVALDHENEDGTAVYLISEDLDKLAAAPKVLAALDAIIDGATLAQIRADAADDAYLNGYYE